jgi:Holliday junction resolvase RusA-like endonuclease
VGIRVETYKDIDNIEKSTIDSLQGICIDNDKNILEKYSLKIQRKRGTKDNLIVWVETIEPGDDFFPFKS